MRLSECLNAKYIQLVVTWRNLYDKLSFSARRDKVSVNTFVINIKLIVYCENVENNSDKYLPAEESLLGDVQKNSSRATRRSYTAARKVTVH